MIQVTCDVHGAVREIALHANSALIDPTPEPHVMHFAATSERPAFVIVRVSTVSLYLSPEQALVLADKLGAALARLTAPPQEVVAA